MLHPEYSQSLSKGKAKDFKSIIFILYSLFVPRIEDKMFRPFQNGVIYVLLNIKCSGDDCAAHCFKVLFVLHLSFHDLTTINPNTNSMVPLYLSISGKWVLDDRFQQ